MIWLTLIGKKIGGFIFPLFKNLKFWLILGLVILGFIVFKQCKSIQKTKGENDRLQNNIKNINQELKVTKTKNGDLVYSVNSLTIKKDELDLYNKNLKNELKDMGIKLKNTQSIIKMQIGYGRKIDTIRTEKIITEYVEVPNNILNVDLNRKNMLQYNFKLDDNDSYIAGTMNIPYKVDSTMHTNNYKFVDEERNPFLTSVEFKFNDSLLIVPTIEYKRVWVFWKKPIGVKTHVKSNNKYFNIDKIYNYQIVK